mgnify:CR=1 FL=1
MNDLNLAGTEARPTYLDIPMFSLTPDTEIIE